MSIHDIMSEAEVVDLPPVEAPAGCWSPLLWSLARQSLVDHRPGRDKHCVICHPTQVAPCHARQIAVLVLNASLFEPVGREVICQTGPVAARLPAGR
ncbi:hypothetical protein QTQ03_29370 [Micromonospora sp. WMMA1363]|uniref:hypothetical protein n=1 Tax=Micromonospora sp. WMMA1363 TaxID=3053985 RepID=UPI00259C9BC2|nr:hypothetical protein [Micromonospora sp. WMMA1363]MDM4723490.1 hypothetical protein [Micromonospora sp. WMMA1363]